MSIIILGDLFSFPEGSAATNRVYTYAKGFIENGENTHVICMLNEYRKSHEGITESIHYYYPFGQNKRNNYFLIRRWYKLRKYYKTFLKINEIHRKDNILGIICYSRSLDVQMLAFFLSQITKSKVISEVSEYPLKNFQKSNLHRYKGNLVVSLSLKLTDGINCISNYLVDFYKERKIPEERLFLVPSTVDPTRFQNQGIRLLPFEYILYCGTLTLQKDGVDILIKSFADIYHKFPQIHLVLIGTATNEEDDLFLKNLAENLNIQDRIHFLGQISRNEVPNYITNAKILALARPASRVAEAGFPSKVTEYLAAGKPLVATKVGEIPHFLTDGENAFLVNPGSEQEFAGKMEYILNNYELASEVGLKGKGLTFSIFNYNYQAGRILDFIKKLP